MTASLSAVPSFTFTILRNWIVAESAALPEPTEITSFAVATDPAPSATERRPDALVLPPSAIESPPAEAAVAKLVVSMSRNRLAPPTPAAAILLSMTVLSAVLLLTILVSMTVLSAVLFVKILPSINVVA